jgi:hypothetical protein
MVCLKINDLLLKSPAPAVALSMPFDALPLDCGYTELSAWCALDRPDDACLHRHLLPALYLSVSKL